MAWCSMQLSVLPLLATTSVAPIPESPIWIGVTSHCLSILRFTRSLQHLSKYPSTQVSIQVLRRHLSTHVCMILWLLMVSNAVVTYTHKNIVEQYAKARPTSGHSTSVRKLQLNIACVTRTSIWHMLFTWMLERPVFTKLCGSQHVMLVEACGFPVILS